MEISNPLASCTLCGHNCRVNRLEGQIGRCKAGSKVGVSSALIHSGEEPPISGGHLGAEARGSGTVFFSRCTLGCCFCQNWQISQGGLGDDLSAEKLADIFLSMAAEKPHNLNLVSPTPYAPLIAQALGQAKKQGFDLPVVYNTGGFDSLSTLKIMEGLVDVYLPDMKIAPPKVATPQDPDSVSARLLGAGYYPWVNRQAINEMFRQVGYLSLDGEGMARKGLLVRHLVLPDNLARTDEVLSYLSETFGPKINISLMAQYFPAHLAADPSHPEFTAFPGLHRRLASHEYDNATDLALALGLNNVYIQELESAQNYLPDFEKEDVFGPEQ